MDPDPLPSLLNDNVRNAGIDRPGRLERHVTMLEEVPQGGSGGGDTKKAASLRALEPLDSDVADALTVEDPVCPGHNVLGIVQAKLEPRVMGELKSPFTHRRHQRGRQLLLAGPTGPLALDRLLPLRGGCLCLW